MISTLSIVFAGISTLLAIIVPIGLSIWFTRKHHAPYTTVLVGALTFFVSQIILRLPLLEILKRLFPQILPTGVYTLGFFLYTFFLALTAGLFEEGGRLLFFKLFIRNRKDWKNAVAMGIGHGGIESALLVGLSLLSNFVIMLLLQTGSLSELLDPALASAFTQLSAAPSYMFLLGGIERMLALIVQIGLSVLVVYSVLSRKRRYFLLAIFFHFMLDFPLAYLTTLGGAVTAEIYIAVCAVISMLWIMKSKALFRNCQQHQEESPIPVPPAM